MLFGFMMKVYWLIIWVQEANNGKKKIVWAKEAKDGKKKEMHRSFIGTCRAYMGA